MRYEKLPAGYGKQFEIPPDIHVPHKVQMIGCDRLAKVFRQSFQQCQRNQATAFPVPDAAFRIAYHIISPFVETLKGR
jgi:hypothetical protein